MVLGDYRKLLEVFFWRFLEVMGGLKYSGRFLEDVGCSLSSERSLKVHESS
jgi:hypothetical protein